MAFSRGIPSSFLTRTYLVITSDPVELAGLSDGLGAMGRNPDASVAIAFALDDWI